jgi:hypothetical protein
MKDTVACFAGALQGVPTRQTGAVGLRKTVPWIVPVRRATAETSAIKVTES